MNEGTVTITGGSGFVGQLLRRGLKDHGFRIDVFDRWRGPLINALRRTWTGADAAADAIPRARRLRETQPRIEHALARARVIRPTEDDILDLRSRLAERFRGRAAVVHLAALPHPNVPGAQADDYRRINRINDPVRIDQFPIQETNHLPTLADGQSLYGSLKADFERYLADACRTGPTQAVALRLECPAVRSEMPGNFYASTSIENTIATFACALKTDLETGFEAFNAVDGHIDPAIVDVQQFLASHWPGVPNHTRGNESLVSIEKARRLFDYRPARGGTYYPLSLIWG